MFKSESREKIVYGAGLWGRLVADFLQKKNEKPILCFVDTYRDAGEIDGIPLLKINQVQNTSADMCVAFENPTKDFVFDLKKRGFSEIYLLDDFFAHDEFLSSAAQGVLWHAPENPGVLSKNKVQIEKLRNMLEDEKSKILLDKIVRLRSNFQAKDYVKPEGQQYFPSDVPVFSGINTLRFIDAGAFQGDTLRLLHKVASERNIEVEAYAGFEPDTRNFSHLVSEASREKGNIFLYPTGVWSKRELLCFKNNRSSSSSHVVSSTRVTSSTQDAHECSNILGVSIDECLYAMQPNFIKMDIEGAEMKALEGASKIIKDFRPTLAICLYHTPTDLWEVPLKINSLCNEYRMYLRVHGLFLYETVLYCIPKK